jgi:adenylosuccinate synthase
MQFVDVKTDIAFKKNADNLSMIPKSAECVSELKAAYTLAEMNTWSKEDLEVYEYWQIRDAAD